MKRVIDGNFRGACVQDDGKAQPVLRLMALGLAGVSALAMAPHAASAQSADDEPAEVVEEEAYVPGEIVVTAQKREQRLSDVGISIVAATAEQLQNVGVTDVSSIGKIAPGFTAARSISGYQIFSIRGINFNSAQISASPTVSTYVDEAALPYSAMTQGLLLDVDHIEVLKGPQGTLFGQNATGGSVNVISAKPTDYLTAGFNAGVNHFGEVNVDGYVSGPLSDTLRARLAFQTTQFGPWQKGYFLNDRKIGDSNRGAARLLLDFTPSDRLKISLNVNGNYDHGEPQAFQFQTAVPQNPAGAAPGLITYPRADDNRGADVDGPQRNDNSQYQTVLRADLELNDDLTLTSITNYIHTNYEAHIDSDGTALGIARDNHYSTAKSFGQELRVAGKIDEPNIHFIIGANYQKDKFREQDVTELPLYSSLPGATFNTVFHDTNRAAAVFGNLELEVADGLTLVGGVRYTETRQSTRGCSGDDQPGSLSGFVGPLANFLRSLQGLAPTDAFAGNRCATLDDRVIDGVATYLPTEFQGAVKEDNVSWRAGVNYKPNDDTLLYALVSRGYKSGGYPFQNTVVISQIKHVRQEELTDFEAGFKTDLADSLLSVEGSGFYYKYNDKQFFSYITVPFIGAAPTSLNIPRSTVKGVDFALTARPADGLTMRGGVTYIKTRIGEYSGIDINGAPVDFTGNRFNFAPPLSGTADINYEFPISRDLDMNIGANAVFNTHTFSDLANSDNSRIDGYAVFDARMGVSSAKGWTASVYVRNLTDKYYWTNVALGSDTINRFTGRPRTVGASFGYQF
ncbi:TonB-dependent receptor [Croceicoccus sediminis]|uniref:TonB-dependent receptor n=1 Tax=Croceicoccus sediminis TaxID=2571150 RepID=UPI001183B4A6|nr:TonB-dependent receptor [Croceicoccus sediminis]